LACALLCAALGATNANAARPKPVLHLEAGGTALAPGAPVSAFGTNFTLSTAVGTISCSADELNGSVTTNLTKKDLVSLEAGSFTGEGEEGQCESTYPEPLREATVVAELLPWELHMNSKGAAEIKAKSKVLKGGVLLRIKALHPPEGEGAHECLYNSAKLKTKFATNGEPVVLTFSEVSFHVFSPESAEHCGKSKGPINLSMSLALSSEGKPVTATFGP
jgi:hypothetical protein